MRELSVQASNDTLTSTDQAAIGSELVSLRDEINRIADTTQFNTKSLLGGSIGTTLNAASEIQQGAAVGATGIVVSKLDVSGAKAGTTYAITAGAAAGSVRLTNTTTG